jgi:hypothetical protein
MDIREFVFRHMHGNKIEGTMTGRITTGRFAPKPAEDIGLRNSEIKNDPECRDLCARFLFNEIWLRGCPNDKCYDEQGAAARFEPLAEYFINNIVPSLTFMEDALNFFNDIREGKI